MQGGGGGVVDVLWNRSLIIYYSFIDHIQAPYFLRPSFSRLNHCIAGTREVYRSCSIL